MCFYSKNYLHKNQGNILYQHIIESRKSISISIAKEDIKKC